VGLDRSSCPEEGHSIVDSGRSPVAAGHSSGCSLDCIVGLGRSSFAVGVMVEGRRAVYRGGTLWCEGSRDFAMFGVECAAGRYQRQRWSVSKEADPKEESKRTDVKIKLATAVM
jgi:hypothetical protein